MIVGGRQTASFSNLKGNSIRLVRKWGESQPWWVVRGSWEYWEPEPWWEANAWVGVIKGAWFPLQAPRQEAAGAGNAAGGRLLAIRRVLW